MHIDSNLTRLSTIEMNTIIGKSKSASEVFLYLNGKIQVRKFADTLKDFAGNIPAAGLADILNAKLIEYNPGVKPDSIRRRVRDWLSGKQEPRERKDFIKICFALKLSEYQASRFLSLTTDGAFHLRNPEELVYAFALRTGMDYPETIEMLNSLGPLDKTRAEGNFVLTKSIEFLFAGIKDKESFHKFYHENKNYLGELHNTAYQYLLIFLEILTKPSPHPYATPEHEYTLDEIMNEYLRMNIPLNKKTANYTLLQKTIKKYWPNTTSLMRMKNRTEDVSRRILLILYLITEGFISTDDDYLLDEDLTELEHFEEHYWRLNSILNECGLARLDPRNVFDWLVLYSLKTSDDGEMRKRMEEVLALIYDG